MQFRTTSSIVAALGAILIVAALAQAGTVNMEPGQWEITTTVKVEGMPGDIPPQTHTTCLSEDDLVPKPEKGGEQCTVSEPKITGDTVEWTMTCDNPKQAMKGTGSGKITYSGDAFEGTTTMSVEASGQPAMKMDAHLKGKRLGPCPE